MAIVMDVVNGRHCQRIRCDECGEVIEESGNAEWRHDGSDERIYFTHKKCCHRFEEKRGGTAEWYTAELSAFLYNVVWNTRIDWAKARQLSEILVAL